MKQILELQITAKKTGTINMAQLDIIYLDKTIQTTDFNINAYKSLLNIFRMASKEYPNIIQIYENEIDGVVYTTQIINVNIKIKSIFETDYALVFGTSGNLRTIFKGNVMLQDNFNKVIFFQDCEFCGYFSAIECNFYNNVFFDNTIFKGYVYFSKSQFNKTACFYGTTFEKTPNFSQAIFNDNLNFINTNLNFNINECKESIKQQLKRQAELYGSARQNTNLMLQRIPILGKIANDFRDSFRSFKSTLIKDNNLLDASNCHKIELYFKEIELDSKKPKIFSKEWIDLWQLKLYRLTSNHHTDLLRIFSLLVILIGCFATTLFFAEYYGNPKIWYGIFWATFGVVSIFTAFGKIRHLGFFTLLSLVPCAWLVSYNPKYIFGVASLFGDNNCNGVFLNFAFSIYTILFILLIFSLQKTARRNSIIPN